MTYQGDFSGSKNLSGRCEQEKISGPVGSQTPVTSCSLYENGHDVIFREYDIGPACLTAIIFRFLHNIDDKLCSSIWIK